MLLLQKACIQVKSDLSALADLLVWFDQFNAPPLPQKVWLHCQLILIEGFTNAVRHAHKDQPIDTLVTIELALFAACLEIRIWDYGAPFDLQHKLETLPLEIDRKAEGGRGLKLMQDIADRISYTRLSNKQNCLLMVKHFVEQS